MLLLVAVLVGFPVVALVLLSAYVYIDAPEHGMEPRKWAAISLLVPFFGFLTYVFERDERTRDDREGFRQDVFELHESRADDVRLDKGGTSSDDEA